MKRQPDVRCVEFVEEASEWVDGALDDARRLELEEHLVICPHCTEYVEQLRAALATLPELDEPPPAATRERLLDLFRQSRP